MWYVWVYEGVNFEWQPQITFCLYIKINEKATADAAHYTIRNGVVCSILKDV